MLMLWVVYLTLLGTGQAKLGAEFLQVHLVQLCWVVAEPGRMDQHHHNVGVLTALGHKALLAHLKQLQHLQNNYDQLKPSNKITSFKLTACDEKRVRTSITIHQSVLLSYQFGQLYVRNNLIRQLI
jgi:hypothetical protein